MKRCCASAVPPSRAAPCPAPLRELRMGADTRKRGPGTGDPTRAPSVRPASLREVAGPTYEGMRRGRCALSSSPPPARKRSTLSGESQWLLAKATALMGRGSNFTRGRNSIVEDGTSGLHTKPRIVTNCADEGRIPRQVFQVYC